MCRIGPLLVLAFALLPHSAFGQADLSGEWSNLTHEDLTHRQSVELGDYTGLPINEAARFKAESWDAAVLSTHERQCIPHVVTYAMRGMPGNIRISKVDNTDTGQIIAYTIHGTYGRPRTIWMDGRPHPSNYAPHSWAGFSTGKWEGNALVVSTTHIKMDWIMRNGVPVSDLATMTEHFIRHDNRLMDVIVVDDPVYLSEPFIRTQDWLLNLGGQPNAYGVCGPAQIIDELPNRKNGYVPHYLPGVNQDLREFPAKRGIPPDAAGGGAETTYPEYRLRLEGRPATAAATRTPNPVPPPEISGVIEVLPVQGNVYMLAGVGGNVAVQVGDDGVLLVDTGAEGVSDKVFTAIRQLSNKPIRIVINTAADSDHRGGNEPLAKSGNRIGGGVLVGGRAEEGAMVIAHEQVLAAMSVPTGKTSPTPAAAWPTDIYPGDSKDLYANGEGIQILHQPAAHTGGDSLVYFRRSDVVVAGDIFLTTSYPVIDAPNGGSYSGVLAGLNRIVDIAIPKDWQEGGTMVIPGHGRIAEESDVVEYRDMITIIGDRIQDMIKKGMTLAQVKGCETDARLRSPIRRNNRPLDDGYVHRGGVSGFKQGDKMSGCECKPARSVSAVARNLKHCAQPSKKMTSAILVILTLLLSAQAPQTPRTSAPIDLTGYWVSVVTEDWRWRVLTPSKGDYTSLPLNAEGRRVADTWDAAKAANDGCKPYGAAALLRMPGRLHITWQDANTLKIETDAGLQTRLLQFDKSVKPGAARTWPGHSVGEWEFAGGRGGARGQPRAGSLKVVTTNLRAGYLRKNGVPYSEDAVVTEYFDRLKSAGSELLTVITVVDDPKYLTQPFTTSTHFKREPDGSKWAPLRCE